MLLLLRRRRQWLTALHACGRWLSLRAPPPFDGPASLPENSASPPRACCSIAETGKIMTPRHPNDELKQTPRGEVWGTELMQNVLWYSYFRRGLG